MYVSVYAIYYGIQSKEDEPCLCAGEFRIFGKKRGFEQHSFPSVLTHCNGAAYTDIVQCHFFTMFTLEIV